MTAKERKKRTFPIVRTELYKGYKLTEFYNEDNELACIVEDDFGVRFFCLEDAKKGIDYLIKWKQKQRQNIH